VRLICQAVTVLWRVETGFSRSVEVLWSIDKLSVAHVIIEVFILVIIILQTLIIA